MCQVTAYPKFQTIRSKSGRARYRRFHLWCFDWKNIGILEVTSRLRKVGAHGDSTVRILRASYTLNSTEAGGALFY